MKRMSFYAFFVLFSFFAVNLTAQEDTSTSRVRTDRMQQNDEFATTSRNAAQDMSRDLSTRLSLTPDQQESLNEIFWNYQRDISSSSDPNTFDIASSRANDRIDQVLNENQRTTWEAMRESWWSDMRVRYGNTGTNKRLQLENEARQDRTDVDENTYPEGDRQRTIDPEDSDNSTKNNRSESDRKTKDVNPHDEPVNRDTDVDRNIK